MQFVNLTPEVINFVYKEGEICMVSLPPSGKVAKVITKQEAIGKLIEWPVWKLSYPRVIDLPEPKEGVCYLVTMEVAQFAKRRDVLAVDTDTITLENGEQVTGVSGFVYVDCSTDF
jgi:hypothetical protein